MNVILENAMFNVNSSTLEEFDCDEVEYLFIKKIMYDFYLHGEFTLIPNTDEAISFIFNQFIEAGFGSITLNSIYYLLLFIGQSMSDDVFIRIAQQLNRIPTLIDIDISCIIIVFYK